MCALSHLYTESTMDTDQNTHAVTHAADWDEDEARSRRKHAEVGLEHS